MHHLISLGSHSVMVHDVCLKHLAALDHIRCVLGQVVFNIHVLDIGGGVKRNLVVPQTRLVIQGRPVCVSCQFFGDVTKGCQLGVGIKVEGEDHLATKVERSGGLCYREVRVKP